LTAFEWVGRGVTIVNALVGRKLAGGASPAPTTKIRGATFESAAVAADIICAAGGTLGSR
jgi:hypothetical protein